MNRVLRCLPAFAVALALTGGAVAIKARGTGQTAVPSPPDDRTIAHVLNRLGFGPAPGDFERVRTIGLDAYIDRQLHPERLQDSGMAARLARLRTVTKSTRELADSYFLPAQMARRLRQQRRAGDPAMTPPDARSPAAPQPDQEAIRAERQVLVELSEQKILRAAYSERQLQEVMVDFWFNHFNVFAGKGQTRMYLTEYERDVIRPHALGRFRDLLGATAASPAMLFYLDNWQSAAPAGTAVPARRAPQSPRRGMVRAGAAGQPPRTMADLPRTARNRSRGLNENYARELLELHTLGVDGGYTQADVQEVARAFTGWTIANPRQGGSFVFDPRLHDGGEKRVLGHTLPAGGGRRDGERVLDILAGHPSTARHIAAKLARRLVADRPPPALVDRAARRFLETGGDLREVVRTIVTSPEFFAPAARRAKIKSPFEFVVSAIRATAAEAANAAPLVQAVRELGMPLFMCQPPTGYGDTAESWVNTGALLNRMSFAVALAGGRIRGITVPMAGASSLSPARVLTREVLAGDVSAATAKTVAKAGTAAQAIALVLGSPDFQKR